MPKQELNISQTQAQQLLKFTLSVAKLEEGCGPSVGFMIDVIKRAKAAIGDDSLCASIEELHESIKRSDLEALIYVNIPSKYVKENTVVNQICKKIADDIQYQFELTYKKEK